MAARRDREEGEELGAPALGLAQHLGAGLGDGRRAQQVIEPPLGLGAILGQRAVLQVRPSSPHRDGPAQQPAQGRRGEANLASVDGILDVAQDVGEADLVGVGMALLGAPAIRYPAARPMLAEHRGDDLARPRGVDADAGRRCR